MFIKRIDKSSKKTGKNYFTYRLCESYRIDNKVRHRNILNVGKLENVRKEDFKLLCDRIEQKVRGINPLFSNFSDNVEKEAEFIYRRILNEKWISNPYSMKAAVFLVENGYPNKCLIPVECLNFCHKILIVRR
jgi:ribosomal protein L20